MQLLCGAYALDVSMCLFQSFNWAHGEGLNSHIPFSLITRVGILVIKSGFQVFLILTQPSKVKQKHMMALDFPFQVKGLGGNVRWKGM